MNIFRFTTSDGSTVRLNLNDTAKWHLGRGLVLGTRHYEKTSIAQPPFSGVKVVGAWEAPVQMQVPLLYNSDKATKTAAQIMADWEALRTECSRLENTIEMREPGAAASIFIDIYGPIDTPSFHQGQATPNAFLMGGFTGPVVLQMERVPDLRGAGAAL